MLQWWIQGIVISGSMAFLCAEFASCSILFYFMYFNLGLLTVMHIFDLFAFYTYFDLE